MLKRILALLAVVALAAAGPGLSPALPEQGQDGKTPLKVGVVNLKSCFEKYDRIKEIDLELTKLAEEYTKELQRLQKKMDEIKSKLDALHKDMQLYWEKLGEFKLTENEYKFRKEFGRQRYLNRYAELRIEVYNEVRQVVNLIGAEQKFDLIMRVEEPTIEEENIETVSQRINARVVLYHADSLDITVAVVKRLNEEYTKKKAAAGMWACANPGCKTQNAPNAATCTKCGAKKP